MLTTQRMVKRALRHLVLEHLLWLGGVLETVVLIEVVRWARVSSSDNYGGFRHAGSLGGLGYATMSAGSSEGSNEGVLHLASGRTVRVSTSLFCERGGQSEGEVLVFHQLLVVSQT